MRHNTHMDSTTLLDAPPGAFTQRTRVRSYETGRTGAISIGTMLRYFEGIATEASAALGFDFHWYEAHHSAWVVREMQVLVEGGAGIGDELDLATWVASFKRVQAQREYAIWRQDNGHLVARASARWGYIDRTRLRPVPLPEDLAGHFPVLGHAMPPLALTRPSAEERPSGEHEWLLTARDYEIDSQQHINNAVYADWLLEGLHHALAGDLPSEDNALGSGGPQVYQIEYLQPTLPGEALCVATTVWARSTAEMKVSQRIASQRDGGVRVRARSEQPRASVAGGVIRS